MEYDAYAPPAAAIAEVPATEAARAPFYVVATGKFFALFIATFGLYQVYWFWKHWAQVRRATGMRVNPVARAIFAIFFTHALARTIDARLKDEGMSRAWSPGWLATGIVVLNVVGAIAGQLAALPGAGIGLSLLSVFVVVPMAWLAWRVQCAANIACGDAAGASNARLTGANWAWLVFGGLWWALTVVGLLAMMTGVVTDA